MNSTRQTRNKVSKDKSEVLLKLIEKFKELPSDLSSTEVFEILFEVKETNTQPNPRTNKKPESDSVEDQNFTTVLQDLPTEILYKVKDYTEFYDSFTFGELTGIGSSDIDPQDAFCCACERGQTSMVVHILKKYPNLDPNECEVTGNYTPLELAFYSRKIELIRTLLNEPRVKKDIGVLEKCLNIACMQNDFEITKLLLNETIVTPDRDLLERMCSLKGRYSIIQLLFGYKCVQQKNVFKKCIGLAAKNQLDSTLILILTRKYQELFESGSTPSDPPFEFKRPSLVSPRTNQIQTQEETEETEETQGNPLQVVENFPIRIYGPIRFKRKCKNCLQKGHEEDSCPFQK